MNSLTPSYPKPSLQRPETRGLLRKFYRRHPELSCAVLPYGGDVTTSEIIIRQEMYSPLQLAILRKNKQEFKRILKRKPDLEALAPYRMRAMHVAAWNRVNWAVDALMTRNISFDKPDTFKYTPLHLAILAGSPEITAKLLRKGARVDALTEDKETPLALAVIRNQPRLIRLLAAYGADINARNNEDRTLVHIAVAYKATEALNALLDLGAEIDPLQWGKVTPLNAALSKKFNYIAALLLQRGASPLVIGYNNATLFHLCADVKNPEGIRLLLQQGVSTEFLNREDDEGSTAADIGAYMNSTLIPLLLKEAGAYEFRKKQVEKIKSIHLGRRTLSAEEEDRESEEG